MTNTVFGDLTVVTNAELDTTKQWFTVACSDNSVNLMFGDSKTLRINSVGVWSHSVLFWQGKLDDAFEAFVKSLPPGCVIYKNDYVLVLYLKNNYDYGCLRVSVRLHKNHDVIIRNLMSDKYLEKLDRLYDLYIDTMSVDQCLNSWVNKPLNTDLNGVSYDTKQILDLIYQSFTKEFLEDPDAFGGDMEHAMSSALNVPRVQKIRYIISRMFSRAVELSKCNDTQPNKD